VSGGTDIRTGTVLDSLAGLVAEDPDARALALALDPELREIATLAETCALLSRIPQLSEAQADQLARWFRLTELEGWSAAGLARKRAVLAEMVEVYRRRGTRWALERVLGILETPATEWDDGGSVWDEGEAGWDSRDGMYSVEEWWQRAPADPPFTYRIDAGIEFRGLTLDELRRLQQVLDAYVPVRAHLLELSESIALESQLLRAGYPEAGLLIEVP
jgi:P2-related tail formation protein